MLKQVVLGFLVTVSVNGFAAAGGESKESIDLQKGLMELKGRCAELTSNAQLKPFKVVVTCRQELTQWRAGGTSMRELPNKLTIGASVRVKNFDLPYHAEDMMADVSQASCKLYEKWQVLIPAVDTEISCADLDAIDSLSQFCAGVIQNRFAEDPSVAVEQALGETYDTCGGIVQAPKAPVAR